MKNNAQIAIKIEPLVKNRMNYLPYEGKILMKFSGKQGFCKMLHFGYEGNFTVLVMDLLGPSIEQLFVFCEHKF